MWDWRDKYCHVKKRKCAPCRCEDMIWLGGPAAKTHCVIFYTCCDQASDNNQFKEERLYFDLWFEGTEGRKVGEGRKRFISKRSPSPPGGRDTKGKQKRVSLAPGSEQSDPHAPDRELEDKAL